MFKFGCLGVIGLVVLIVIVGMIAGGDDEAGTTTQTPTSGDSKPAKEDKNIAGVIGQELVVGTAGFTVNEVATADQVGPSILPEKASEKFVVVNVTYTNKGNEAVTLDSSFFKLKLGEKTYETDSMASMSANQSDDGSIDNSFFLQSVNPDSTITGNVVFDVNETVADSEEIQLQVQTGIFGTETAIIELR